MQSSAAAGRRGASSSPLSCRASTPAPDAPGASGERSGGSSAERRTGAGFPRSHRLTRGADLQVVRREGKRIRTEHLDVRASASLLHHPRVGIVVPKQKRTSVERNRLKRRLRELVRTRLLGALPPMELVIRTLPEAYGASFASLERQVEKIAERTRTLSLPHPATGAEPVAERRKEGT